MQWRGGMDWRLSLWLSRLPAIDWKPPDHPLSHRCHGHTAFGDGRLPLEEAETDDPDSISRPPQILTATLQIK